jgi:hypothetical protein
MFTKSPCFTGGNVSGTEIANVWRGSLSAGALIYLSGQASGTQIVRNYYVASDGLCNGDLGTFSLARQ